MQTHQDNTVELNSVSTKQAIGPASTASPPMCVAESTSAPEDDAAAGGGSAREYDVAPKSHVSERVALQLERLQLERLQLDKLCGANAKLTSAAAANDWDIAPAQNPGLMRLEVARLREQQILHTSGTYQVAVARREQIPTVVDEIGRLREVSFRAVGEGTGRASDLDQYDDWYQHLFVWDTERQQVLGAYRIAMTDVVQRRYGMSALYTSSLFSYSEEFLDRQGCAMEMGRSFVRPEHQRSSRVLALLWKGIGRIICERPRYSTLFGPVSISASYSQYSRQLIAASLMHDRHRHALTNLVRPLRPAGTDLLQAPISALEARELSRLVSRAEADGKGLPILVREYLKLGGKFLAFSTDPEFAGALDGLVSVDLRKTSARLLNLYMGPEHYCRFRDAHSC